MASEFKALFEDLVILMKISEAQQAKQFLKNISITKEQLLNVYITPKTRICYLHAKNLEQALAVIVRGAFNRSDVSQDEELKKTLADLVCSF